MINFYFLIFTFFILVQGGKTSEKTETVIGRGKMPNVVKDRKGNIHIVYGTGDSIMYVSSKNGRDFTSPTLVAVLPELFATAMRGPQIAASQSGITITACSKKGNIFSYRKDNGSWSKPARVNDVDEVAKEALMSLSGDGNITYAVWLAVKQPKGQNLLGAISHDGGLTWSKNVLVYRSPDGTICECCKPSVVVKDQKVNAMFRNWLGGSRDLFVVQSSDGGKSFEKVQKLGEGTWKLQGCPMDGGGLAVGSDGRIETVWRREGKIYAAQPGKPEREIGEGRGCTIEIVNDKPVYAWGQNGEVILMKPDGEKKNLGKGSLPLVKNLGENRVLCVWENDESIHASIAGL